MRKNKFGLLIIFIGIIIVIYPIIANILVSYTQTNVISGYNEMIEQMEEEQISKELEKARKYNERLNLESEIKVHVEGEEKEEKTSYLNVLNVGEIIGYLDIPKIDAYLPIYHGTNDNVLQSGVGHVESSSFPIGEKDTHAVLAGHSGLARTKVFDDIDKLQEGDMFFLHMFGEMFAYEINQIKVVLPEETKDVEIVKDKEYVTLLTCTPFAINSHRLLVRGERVEGYVIEEQTTEDEKNQVVAPSQKLEEKIQKNKKDMYIVVIFTILIIIISRFIIIKFRKTKDKKRKKPRISKSN